MPRSSGPPTGELGGMLGTAAPLRPRAGRAPFFPVSGARPSTLGRNGASGLRKNQRLSNGIIRQGDYRKDFLEPESKPRRAPS